MAEVKNSFLGSKMNQDLDDRLIPNNEYRKGVNISVSNSEQNDVGALETILGNTQVAAIGETIIGNFVSEVNDTIYLFATNHTDGSVNELNTFAPTTALCKIYSYNVLTNTLTTIVSGYYLNFSTTHPIYGVNLLENLLFWTDNRNQPRKINVQTANNNPSYYSSEDDVSVAKYAPFQAIQMFKETSTGSGVYKTTMKDVVSATLPDGNANPDYQVDDDGNPNYAGDKNYLADRFVRFSYRFKFDDGEYSIMAPFTQVAFIPKQDGSFIDKYNGSALTESDEEDAYKSTIVKFMENKVNNIKLIIPLEYQAGQLGDKLKISEVEILYKESDSNLVRSVEEIPISSFTSADKFYEYDYQSTKPTKVLPSSQSTRVYDTVPVRAMAQEVAGNRVIYSNYINKHTAPSSIDYSLNVSGKLPATSDATSRSLEEYPEHTVKQNRNYQVGIVLSDRYGRQSGVILSKNTSSLVTSLGEKYGSSTIYAPYKVLDPVTFFGDSLKVLFNSEISSSRSPLTEFDNQGETGEPGLYDATSEGLPSTLIVTAVGNGYVAGTYDTTVQSGTGGTGTGLRVTIATQGGFITGAVVAESGSGYEVGDTVNITTTSGTQAVLGIGSLVDANPLGWYSYKIVVKQNEQEYYNVYVPDIISGNIETATTADQEKNIAFLGLISDNINKVPRDLQEVGPDQKSFNSSSILFPRVDTPGPATNAYNKMFSTGQEGSFVNTIATLDDLTGSDQSSNSAVYQSESDPLIGKMLTPYEVGKPFHNNSNIVLGVLETEPVESLIDIYWETSTSGLISELNEAIRTSEPNTPNYIIDWNFDLDESDTTGTLVSTTSFKPRDASGRSFNSSINIISIEDELGNDRSSDFTLTGDSANGYNFQVAGPGFFYGFDADTRENYKFKFNVINNSVSPAVDKEMSLTGKLGNIAPTITPITVPPTYVGMPNPILNLTGENGSALSVYEKEGLSFTFENGLDSIRKDPSFGSGYGAVDFNLSYFQAGSWELTYSYTDAYPPDSVFNLNITLTDAGGLTDTETIAIDFGLGEFRFDQFTKAFNL
jgi:hypothetical protein